MKKGISSVIATLLLVVITIGLAGSAYFFINNIAQRQTQNAFQILEVSGNIIVISNLGTEPILANNLKIVVDGTQVSFSIDGGSIQPNNVGRVIASWSLSEGMHKLMVFNKGYSQTLTFYYSPYVAYTVTTLPTTTLPTTTQPTTTLPTTTQPTTTLPTTTQPTTTRPTIITSTTPTPPTIVPCSFCGLQTLGECSKSCGFGICVREPCGNNFDCYRCSRGVPI